MFKTGDLNPHYFRKPTLFIYLNALAYIPYYLFGRLVGVFRSPANVLPPTMVAMGVGIAPMPTAVVMGRLLTVLFATASVFLTYLCGKQMPNGTAVGLLAALMVAISPTNVANSRLITANSYLTFFILVVLWASLRIHKHGRTLDYALAGIATGLAVSSKYPGIVVAVVPLAAHLLRPERMIVYDRRLLLFVVLVPIAFLVGTPFALLDHTKFLEDTLKEAVHYSTGHAGMEGNSFGWYLRYMWQTASILYVLSGLEILRGVLARSKQTMLLSVFPLVYFAFISSFEVRNDRTFLPLTPFLFQLAASLLVHLLRRANLIRSRPWRHFCTIAMVGLIVVGLGLPTSKAIADTLRLTTTDSRETARVWIDENIPAGARIAIEPYSPFVDPGRFSVHAVERIIEHEPEWYVDNGFQYLVFSQGMYGRFYHKPEGYSEVTSQYDSFFDRFTLTKMFRDGGYEVRVYATD
jgi:4-amino-4-deoxy-L-arabinose transferase-like glycosyltransferase